MGVKPAHCKVIMKAVKELQLSTGEEWETDDVEDTFKPPPASINPVPTPAPPAPTLPSDASALRKRLNTVIYETSTFLETEESPRQEKQYDLESNIFQRNTGSYEDENEVKIGDFDDDNDQHQEVGMEVVEGHAEDNESEMELEICCEECGLTLSAEDGYFAKDGIAYCDEHYMKLFVPSCGGEHLFHPPPFFYHFLLFVSSLHDSLL